MFLSLDLQYPPELIPQMHDLYYEGNHVGLAVDALLRSSVCVRPYLIGAIAQVGFRQEQIPYVKAERNFGITKWTLGRKFRAFVAHFVAFSYALLLARGDPCPKVLDFSYTTKR